MEISVIVPVYNGEKYLKRCIDSILAQTFTDFEVILVNDGSSDNSAAILDEYAALDSRVRIIHKEKSEGAGPARNSGIDASTGKFVMFLDADDLIEDNMFETLLNEQREHNSDLVICSYQSFVDGVDNYLENENYESAVISDKDTVRKFFVENFPDGIVGYLWNKLYKGEIIRENNLRFPDMRRLQDGVFNISYFGCIDSCKVIDRPLYHYMLNPQTGLFKKCPKDYFELIKRFSTDFLSTARQWGFDTTVCDKNISVFFLNELGNCLENAKSPNWGMHKAERKAYFAKLGADEFVRERLHSNVPLGNYRSILLKLLTGGHYGMLSSVISVKIGLKKNMKNFFYALKGRNSK